MGICSGNHNENVRNVGINLKSSVCIGLFASVARLLFRSILYLYLWLPKPKFLNLKKSYNNRIFELENFPYKENNFQRNEKYGVYNH